MPFLLYSGNILTPIYHIVSQSAEQAANPTSLPLSYAPRPRTSSSLRSSHKALLQSSVYRFTKSFYVKILNS